MKTIKELRDQLNQHAIANSFRDNSLTVTKLIRDEMDKTRQTNGTLDEDEADKIISKYVPKLGELNNQMLQQWNNDFKSHHFEMNMSDVDNDDAYYQLLAILSIYKMQTYQTINMNKIDDITDQLMDDNDFLEDCINHPDGLTHQELDNAKQIYRNTQIETIAYYYLLNGIEIEEFYLDALPEA